MALPPIVIPEGLLPWLRTPHDVNEEDIYSYVASQTGASRTRRVFTAGNRTMHVSLLLNDDRRALFFDWYEITLKAGAVTFSIQVQDFGPDLVWFEAYMPTYDYTFDPEINQGYLEADVYLLGSPSVDGPELGAFQVRIQVPVEAQVGADQGPPIFVIDLQVRVIATIGKLDVEVDMQVPVIANMLDDGTLPPGVILRQSRRVYVPPAGDTVVLRQRALDYTPPVVII